MTPDVPRSPVAADAVPAAYYDGTGADALAALLQVPAVALYGVVGSTMDVAHELAADGARGGTTVLADRQVAGRGRHGRAWRSEGGQGIWMTILERPADASGVEVLSLRVGLAIAEALTGLAPSAVQLKWPNDVHVAGGKLAGVLIEARWRDQRLDWLAIGIGLNVRSLPDAPDGAATGALRPEVTRLEALQRIVPAVRGAAAAAGPLTPAEVARFHARDLAVGRVAVAPSPGVVAGIDMTGAVTIVGQDGRRAHRAGSLVLVEAV